MIFLILPTISTHISFLFDALNSLRISAGVFWKVANYADAYWFLYSNKKVLHETLIQVGNRS